VLLIILIVVITYCVWSNLVGRLFNKFGWVIALAGVLLLLIFAIVLSVNRSNQKVPVSDQSKNSIGETKKQIIDSEPTTESTSVKERTAATDVSEQTPDSPMPATKEKKKISEPIVNSSNLNSSVEAKVESGVEVGLNSNLTDQDSGVLRLIEKPKEIIDQKIILLPDDTRTSVNDSIDTKNQTDNTLKVDIMRVDNQKETVVAGLAQPNTIVEVLADGQVIGSTKADDQGEFVVMGTLGETSESQTLTVRSGTSITTKKND
jgi:hypothetical protein